MQNLRIPPVEFRQAHALTVPPERFGLNYIAWPGSASASSQMQNKVCRLHDYSGGSPSWRNRWSKVEPSKGVFDWAGIDTAVDQIRAAGSDVLFTVFGSPTWASARPTEIGVYGVGSPGIAAEPANMADLSDFCTALATRFAGRIKYYEIWNEVNAVGFFSGSQAKLAEMVRIAATAIKTSDPSAVIVGPSVTFLWAQGNGREYFQTMYGAPDGAGGALRDWVDIVSVHLYSYSFARISEVQVMLKAVRDAMVTAGVSGKPLWNTEHTVLGPDFATLTPQQRQASIRRMVLIPLVSAYGGCDHSVIYGPDSSAFGFAADDIAEYNDLVTALHNGRISDVRLSPDGRMSYIRDGSQVLVEI